jgi:hypothetical protein
VIPSIERLTETALDITAPDFVQVEWDKDRKVFYVHVNGITVLRMCRVEHIDFQGKLQEERIPEAME